MTARPKGGLGRGLSALIPGAEVDGRPAATIELEIAQILTQPDQPRRTFSPQPLEELVQSIKAQGVLQPLLVTPREGKYLLVAGERRLRAAKAADLFKVPCRILENLNDVQILEISLVENLQREDLNPIELAEGYRRLVDDIGLNHEEVALKVGKDRVTITNTLRLLKLPQPVKEMVLSGSLSSGHARALLGIKSDNDKVEIAHNSVSNGLSVRELEKLIQVLNQNSKKKRTKKVSSQDILARDTAKKLEENLGMQVKISHKNPGGKLTIHYTDLDELDRLILLLQRRTSRD